MKALHSIYIYSIFGGFAPIKTNLTTPFIFTKLHVPRQERKRSFICVCFSFYLDIYVIYILSENGILLYFDQTTGLLIFILRFATATTM